MTDATTTERAARGKRSAAFVPEHTALPAVKKTELPPKPEPTPAQDAAAVDVESWLPEGFVRKPFGSQVQKLAYPPRPGFHRHWFNDTPGRVARALEAGYKHVLDKDGRNVARIVGVAATGGGQNAFLMEVPEQWWRDDKALLDKARDELDAKLRRGVVKDHAPGRDGAYEPVNRFTGTPGTDINVHGR